MWYAPKPVECKKCKRLLNQQEFPYNDLTNKYESKCYDCRTEDYRKKNGVKKTKREMLVKPAWADAVIKLKDRAILGREIRETDIKEIIDEGYFFILREKTIRKI
jgi:hypothetical protein